MNSIVFLAVRRIVFWLWRCVHFLYRVMLHLPRVRVRRLKGWFHSGRTNVSIGLHSVIGGAVTIQEGVTIEDYVRMFGEPKVNLGRNVYVNCFTMMLGDIEIEDDVLISQHVVMWGRSHKFDDPVRPIWVQHGGGGQGYKTGKIVVRKGAWIGPHAVILRGVTIGAGAVIGAGSVVTRDIPDYAVAFGVPARVERFRGEGLADSELGADASLPRRIIEYWDGAGICSFDSSTCGGDPHLASCTNFVESRLLEGLLKRHGLTGGNGLAVDIGAGLGRFTLLLARNLGCVYALEPAPSVYRGLVTHCTGMDNVKTFMADFESFEIQDDCDIGVISGVFYLYTDEMVSRAMSRFAKHCGPGGILVVRDFIVKEKGGPVPSSYIDGGFCYYRDMSYWTRVSKDHSFELVEVFQAKPSYPVQWLMWLVQRAGLTRLFRLTAVKAMMYQRTETKREKGVLDFRTSPILTVFMVMRKR